MYLKLKRGGDVDLGTVSLKDNIFIFSGRLWVGKSMKAKLGSITFRGNKRKSFLGMRLRKGFQILEEPGENRDGIEFQKASISSGSKEPRSALESRRVSLGAHWVD